MIRVDAVWLCTEPRDMRAGTDTALARVVQVFGAARAAPCLRLRQPSLHAAEGLKALVHDGIGSMATGCKASVSV